MEKHIHICGWFGAFLWENIKYGFSMLMKEEEKPALNVKIEKLLFLFSWQNIFIAFLKNEILGFYERTIFQPLIKTFRPPFTCFNLHKALCEWNVFKNKIRFWITTELLLWKERGKRAMMMMEVKCFSQYVQRENDVKSRIINSKISFSRIYRLIFRLGSRT